MVAYERQHDLFNKNDINHSTNNTFKNIHINKKVIEEWQSKIINHQSLMLENGYKNSNQSSLFETASEEPTQIFNPLELTPLSLSFWRRQKSIHEGAAIYFVIDKTINFDKNIILYIGETLSAEKRWKGDHDCKNYLSNYSEALQKEGLTSQLNIRFWLDVPSETKDRRKLEQDLIQTWLPPFNKETRGIWSTPFTSQIN